MSDRARVLLFEPNRYRALLISRMLSREFGSAIVARFVDSSGAIRELSRNHYQIAIVSIDSLADQQVAHLHSLLKANPDLELITLESPETPKAVVSAVSRIFREYPVCRESSNRAALATIKQAIANIIQPDYLPESAGQFVVEQAVNS